MNVLMHAGALAALATVANAGAMSYTGSGGTLSDGVNFTSTITVPASANLTDFVVTLEGMTHTWVGDLSASITHVDSGTTVRLFHRIGASGGAGSGDASDFNGNYRFHPGNVGNLWTRAAALGSNAAIEAGDYFTSTTNGNPTSFTNFVGRNAGGNWTLAITDANGTNGHSGSLGGWRLELTMVPTPGAVALFGLGAVAMLRRRR